MKITRKSPISGNVNTLDLNITEEQVSDWMGGTLVQNAFPQLTPSEREFIVTGILDSEWNDMFGEEIDE
tara:strand:- start:225 stop:431 length:207 start_codon:yes stop_codon:yes gene_type:complete